jgi:hypothetical protein
MGDRRGKGGRRGDRTADRAGGPNMKRQLARWGMVSNIVCALVLSGSVAYADHLDVEVVQPEQVSAGDTVTLQVVVRSAHSDEVVSGATVVAKRQASIVGFSGEVEMASAVTGEDGIAVLSWVERGSEAETVLVAYSAPSEDTIESEPLSVYMVGQGPQLERSESGVDIPGLGAWVLIGVLVGIWAVIQFALVGPVQVARLSAGDGEGGENRTSAGST